MEVEVAHSNNAFFSQDFFFAVYEGGVDAVRDYLQNGQSVNEFDNRTGLQALHIATGRDNLILPPLLSQ
jgi:hypothetical protein